MRTDECLAVLVLAVVLPFLWRWLKRWGDREAARQEESVRKAGDWRAWAGTGCGPPPAPPDATLDEPVPFGYKTNWLAIRCEDPEQVLEAIGLPNRVRANWATGLANAERTGVFVSPPLEGFVLVVNGEQLEDWNVGIWERLRDNFSEVQLYESHRVSSYYCWEKYENGRLIRGCCYVEDRVEEDVGPLTPEEQAVMLARPCFPDEESVLDIAAAWGVDPRFERTAYPPSTGWLCTWRQEEEVL